MKVNTYFKHTLLGFLLLLLFFSAQAQEGKQKVRQDVDAAFEVHSHEGVPHFSSLFSKSATQQRATADQVAGTVVHTDKDLIAQVLEEQYEVLSMDIPLEDAHLKVKLIRTDLGEVNIRSGSGEKLSKEFYSKGVFYHGYIDGERQSIGAISFFEDDIYGMFSSGTHSNISFAKLNEDEYLIYPDKDFNREHYTFCSTVDEDSDVQYSPTEVEQTMDVDNCVEVEWVVSHALYLKKGTAITGYMQGVFNNMQALYANENINFKLRNLVVNTSNDGYNYNDSEIYLDDFTDNYPHTDPTLLYHLIDNSGRNLGGIAYVGVLCNSGYNTAYSDIGLTYSSVPDYSWTISVVAHETGHNLGSRHTQWCGWPGGPIDNCVPQEGNCSPGPPPTNGGTIMSYCHITSHGINFQNGFGPLPGNLMRDKVYNASCLSSCVLDDIYCQNENSQGSKDAPDDENSVVVTCINAGQYLVLNNCEENKVYKITSSKSSDYITIRKDSYDGEVVQANASPITIASPVNGTLYIHINTDFSCGTENICRTLTIDCLNCGSSSGPDNDNPCDATSVSCADVIEGNTHGGTLSGEESYCLWINPLIADVWYKLEVDSYSDYEISTIDLNGSDLLLAVYSGTCSSLEEIGCSDSYYAGGAEVVELNNLAPGTYYVRVASYDTGAEFELSITCGSFYCDVEYGMDAEGSLGNIAAGLILACDFPVAAGQTMPIHTISFLLNNGADELEVSIYKDASGSPGQEEFPPTVIKPEMKEVVAIYTGGEVIYDVRVDLSSYDINLSGGSGGTYYWVALRVNNSRGETYWLYSENINNGTYFRLSIDNYGSWASSSQYGYNHDGAFSINCPLPSVCETCNVSFYPTVMLQGAYDSESKFMHTKLRDAVPSLIPSSQPYNVAPFNYSGNESRTNMPVDVVDWVLVSLRDGADYNTVLERRAGLLFYDGTIRAVDLGPLQFSQSASSAYYIEVQHRNHLGIMTSEPITLSGSPVVNFTDENITSTYGQDAQYDLGDGLKSMYAGDINSDGFIYYSGYGNDNNTLLNTHLQGNKEGSQSGYLRGDLNLDGIVKYNGEDNDHSILLDDTLDGDKKKLIQRQY